MAAQVMMARKVRRDPKENLGLDWMENLVTEGLLVLLVCQETWDLKEIKVCQVGPTHHTLVFNSHGRIEKKMFD